MEKFSTLFRSYENVYAQGAPLIICARALIKDNENGKVFVQLKFRNITEKVISAVKINIECFDAFGNKTDYIEGYQYLELFAKRNDEFGNKKVIPLQDNNSRSFKVKCTEVLFADGTSFVCDDSEKWLIMSEQVLLKDKLGEELAAQYRRDTFAKAVFVPDSSKDIWRCACGAINKSGEEICGVCKNERIAQYLALDPEELSANLLNFKIAEQEKAEAARIAEELQKEKNKKIVLKVLPIVAAVVAVIVLFTAVIIPQGKYKDAVALMDNGEYIEAIAAFEELKNFKDSPEMILECKYLIALGIMDDGKNEEAIAAFEEIIEYKDSSEKIDECQRRINEKLYQDAAVLMAKEQYEEAIDLFNEIQGYKDSDEKIEQCRDLNNEKKYQKAVALFEEGKFDESIKVFKEIAGYKDSSEQIETVKKEQKYQEAVGLMNKGKYKEAVKIFEQIKGYRDSDKKIKTCNNNINGVSSGVSSGTTSSKGFNVQHSTTTVNQGKVTKTYRLTCKKCGLYQNIKIDFGKSKSGVTEKVKCVCSNKDNITFK